MIGGSNPKFLKYDKKVPYNIRLPQRLIDKYNSYAGLTGNTTTNIINKILIDFISDKVVLNDYLDNIGGVSLNIPYSIIQKNNIIYNKLNLIEIDETDFYDMSEYFTESFEVKKIPNNLDIFVDDSYIANVKLFNKNTIHSGIELFVYTNITDQIFKNDYIFDDFDSFTNCLYCLYFEVDASGNVDIYLIDYIHAINLLSASGNDDYKDLVVACVTKLENVDEILIDMQSEYQMQKKELDAEYYRLSNDGLPFTYDYDKYKDTILKKYKIKCDNAISEIAKTYNSNNIIPFGSDIFERIRITNNDDLKRKIIEKDFENEVERIINDILVNDYKIEKSDEK